jgi:four helix bundle protein
MSKYKQFEDLPVWNDAIRLAKSIIDLSAAGTFRRVAGYRDQIERAVVSVSNNIAEGFERGTINELIAYLFIAKGSVGEVRSMLHLLERLEDAPELTADLAKIKALSVSVSRQLGGWIDSLRSSGIEGFRTLDEQARERREQERRAKVFLETMRQVQADALRRGSSESNPAEPQP